MIHETYLSRNFEIPRRRYLMHKICNNWRLLPETDAHALFAPGDGFSHVRYGNVLS